MVSCPRSLPKRSLSALVPSSGVALLPTARTLGRFRLSPAWLPEHHIRLYILLLTSQAVRTNEKAPRLRRAAGLWIRSGFGLAEEGGLRHRCRRDLASPRLGCRALGDLALDRGGLSHQLRGSQPAQDPAQCRVSTSYPCSCLLQHSGPMAHSLTVFGVTACPC